MYSIEYIMNEIMSIDMKISEYETAKTALEAVKKTCNGHITNLDDSHKKLTGNQDLSAVKKSDVFEGEMADKLATRIAAYQADMNDLITKANEIISDIDTQLSTISTNVDTLKQNRVTWEIHLQITFNQP